MLARPPASDHLPVLLRKTNKMKMPYPPLASALSACPVWSASVVDIFRRRGGGRGDHQGDIGRLVAAAHLAREVAKRHLDRIPEENVELNLFYLQVMWRHISLGRMEFAARLYARAPHWRLPALHSDGFVAKLEDKIEAVRLAAWREREHHLDAAASSFLISATAFAAMPCEMAWSSRCMALSSCQIQHVHSCVGGWGGAGR